MLRLVASPLGSDADGGLVSVITGLDFATMSPFGDGLTKTCKADTGKAFEEALGVALWATGEAACSTALRAALGIALGTALLPAVKTALGTALGKAPAITVGCSIGGELELGLEAALVSATVTVLMTLLGTVFEMTLVMVLGMTFWALLGIESGVNSWTTSGRTLGTASATALASAFGTAFAAILKGGFGTRFTTALDTFVAINGRCATEGNIDATCGGSLSFRGWLDVTLSGSAPAGRRRFHARAENLAGGTAGASRSASTGEVRAERIGSPRIERKAGLINGLC